MIQIEVTDSADFDALGVRTFYFNEIFIGSKKGNVLIIDDKIIDYHFKIEVNENKIMGSLHPDLKSYLLNGKLSQGKNHLKINDKITLGNSILVLKSATFEVIPTYKEQTNINLDALLSKNDPVLEILKKIEKVSKESLK
ncbi:MAG: FHA domain-containing protein [Bacteriovoracaceae bacterium]